MKLHVVLLAAAAALAGAAPPEAPSPSATPQADPSTAVLDLGEDRHERMTVPVSIEGSGPYDFIVDTGAERTVIATDLAHRLSLSESGKTRVHSMTEVSDIATVLIRTLDVGGKRYAGIQAPALERANLGAEGMLGVDTLQSQRVSFDFPHNQMTVVASRKMEEPWAEDAIVVTGRSRFGHLVLVDASVDGQKVWVIVDTGAQSTVGNSVLRRKLEARHRLGATWSVTMVSVTGGNVKLGGANVYGLPVAFADVHPFRQLGLMDRPALLLGMDALKLFDRVSVDFANRRVRLLGPGRSESGAATRLAARS
jgi:predicted aspartyl protease